MGSLCFILIPGRPAPAPGEVYRERPDVEPMKKVTRNRDARNHLQIEDPPRFRISGVSEGIPTLQMANVIDLTLNGALIEHHSTFQPKARCFLQLGSNGDLLTIRCRLVESRGSPQQGGGLCYQTRVEFLDLSPTAERALRGLISSRAHGSWNGGGP